MDAESPIPLNAPTVATEPAARSGSTAGSGSNGDLSTRVVQTHSATLFFVGDHVYKVKSAVDLGFFDHRTVEARRRACEQEVELNSRLAPDVYDGVLDVTDPRGHVVEYVVSMRRMAEDRRLSRCIERGEDLDATLRAVARAVSTLHQASTPQEHHDRNAAVDAVRGRWVEGFEQLAPLTQRVPRPERMQRIESLVQRYLDGRTPMFDQRIEQGWIRDGHGDLQAEDIFVLADGPRILDCIEFGDDYRWGDVLADVGFLAMDLERLGRDDLARRFLEMHREFTGDVWPASLAHHYIAYRAHVRAKVGILRHTQHDEPIGAEVDTLIDLALSHLESAQVRLILVGGLPGTGKSTLARELSGQLDAVVLRTDEIRRRSAAPGGYSASEVAAVYQEMFADATRLLELGRSVILDASWSDAARRDEARLVAAQTSSVLSEMRCVLPHDVAAARIRERRAVGTDPSEATEDVAEDMAARFDEWEHAVDVVTDAAPSDVAAQAIATVLEARSL